jgi:hypothetical protein
MISDIVKAVTISGSVREHMFSDIVKAVTISVGSVRNAHK